jgi:preprotein translocase subunit SecE
MPGNVSSPARQRQNNGKRGLNFRYIGEVIGELRRVTWPTRQETMRLTIMVVAVATAIGLFLGIFDIGFSRLIDLILGN